MQRSIRALLCAALVSLLAACGGGGDGGSGGGSPLLPDAGGSAVTPTTPPRPTTPPASTSAVVSGKVRDPAGAPVANATVHIGTQLVTTDAQGRYRVEIDAPGTSTVVLVKSPGHLTTAKQAALVPGQSTAQDIQLQEVDVQHDFLAADGVIAIVNGAVIDIPKNAIKDESGAAYNGPVRLVASYRDPTTVAGVDAFPQPYQGESAGEVVTLQTVGVIEATLATPAGQPLQLRLPATLVYPGVSTIDKAAANIPLWHYDEARTIWIHEGEATRQSDGSYVGTVSHFSVWNLDRKWGGVTTGIQVNFCVNFQGNAGSRSGIFVYLDGPGFSLPWFETSLTSGAHRFLNVPAYTPLRLRFMDQGNGTVQTMNIAETPPGQTIDLQPCASLVGTSDYVPPPPPISPLPVPADTPVYALAGSLSSADVRWDSASGTGAEAGVIDTLTTDSSGAITGRGSFDATAEPMESLSGKMAVGGYFSMTGNRRADGRAPPNGPILFSGRVYVDPIDPTWRTVQGVWSYISPPAGVTTPPNARFKTSRSLTPQ